MAVIKSNLLRVGDILAGIYALRSTEVSYYVFGSSLNHIQSEHAEGFILGLWR